MILANPNLLDDTKLLIKNKKIKELLAFFPLVSNANDTEKITIYRETINNKKTRHTHDTLVPRERIDKVLIWMQVFMSGYLRDSSPLFHREILALLLSPSNEYFAAPRGFSKTTLVQGVINFLCAHKLENFIVVVEKNFTEAAEVLDAVREEFTNNTRIIKFYGDLTEAKNSVLEKAVKERDAQGDFFINGIRLRAKGFNQPIRGLKSREWRPSLIICDDVESDDHIGNPEQRAKYEENYNKGIIPAVDVEGKIKMVGTILHLDSLLSRKIRQHNGKVWRAFYDETRFELTDINSLVEVHDKKRVKLLWSSRWSYSRLMALKKDMVGKGMSTNAFSQELLNDPAGDENRKFKASWLWNPMRRILMADLLKAGKVFSGYCAIDPAESTAEGSDYTGCVVHLIDPDHNRYRVHASRTRRDVKGVIDLIFEIWQEWQPFGLTTIGVEKKAFADQVEPLLREEIMKREIYPNVIELRPMGRQKESRILGNLQGRYEMGNIWTVGNEVSGEFVPVGDTEFLLDELHTFPASEHDDCCFVAGIKISTILGDKNIEDVKRGDRVITPFGIQKVVANHSNGVKSVIKNLGLTGTAHHKVFVGKRFARLDTVKYNDDISRFNFNNLLQWRYKKLLHSTENPTAEWAGRESIISVNQNQMRDEKVLADFTSRFGNFITKRKFRKAFVFIIKTLILSITTLVIWYVSLTANTAKFIGKIVAERVKIKHLLIFKKFARKLKCGTLRQKVWNGIASTARMFGGIFRIENLSAEFAGEFFNQKHPKKRLQFALINAEQKHGETAALMMLRKSVRGAVNFLPSINILKLKPALARAATFNLTIENDGVYYANGILVSNSDAESYAVEMSEVPGKHQESPAALKKKDEWEDLFGEERRVEDEDGCNDDPWG